MKTKILLSAMIIFSLALLNGCKKDADDPVTTPTSTTPPPDAKITGTVLSPSGQPIGSARVSAGPYETLSAANGDFSLDVYHGSYTLIIETGRGGIFSTSLNVSVNSGGVLAITNTQSVLTQTGTLAYVPGSYDAIEDVIAALGYTATAITFNDVSNSTLLSGYDALFLNCGSVDGSLDSTKYMTLLDYVENGGNIYASDYAIDFLTGDGNWRLAQGSQSSHTHKNDGGMSVLSTCITPDVGGFIEDTSLCTTRSGSTGLITGSTINDPFIINLLGQNTIDIHYDLPSWAVINSYDTPFNPLITDATYGALAVKSNQFGENGGVIIFTTFHNEPQGSISADVSDILEYFILSF